MPETGKIIKQPLKLFVPMKHLAKAKGKRLAGA